MLAGKYKEIRNDWNYVICVLTLLSDLDIENSKHLIFVGQND
jgi:hypothetical protein